MKIALDYDGTYTADRVLWKAFVRNVLERGHEVVFCTFRMQDWTLNHQTKSNDDIETSARRMGIPIVYTNGKPKKECYQADIWIDDIPETITTDYDTLKPTGVFKKND